MGKSEGNTAIEELHNMNMDFYCEECGEIYSRPTYDRLSSRSTKDFWNKIVGEKYGLCRECYKKQKALDLQKKSEALELPALTGTEKQIKWATEIRILKYDASKSYWEESNDKRLEMLRQLFSIPQAKFWIDNRNFDIIDIINRMKTRLPPEIEEEIRAQEAQERLGRTVILQPENPVTNRVVEIRVKEDEVLVLSDKDDRIVKMCRNLQYEFRGGWRKSINYFTGPAIDRAAEITNRLLNEGFPVTIDNKEAADKAVSGDFELECLNWIRIETDGKYEGWLSIRWGNRSSDLYKTARTLPRSEYNRPSVVVPIKYYEEVEDFARLYNFRFSPAAQEAIETYKKSVDLINISPKKPPKREKAKGLKGILESGNDVLDDLKD